MPDNDYMTVKEFSQHTGITAASLRHYDRIGLLMPVTRSGRGNYRLYSPLQITSAIDPAGKDSKCAGRYLTAYTRGFYGETNGLPERMADYAKKRGLEFTGPVYNTYLTTELSENDHHNCLLQAAVPVKETRRPPLRHLRFHRRPGQKSL